MSHVCSCKIKKRSQCNWLGVWRVSNPSYIDKMTRLLHWAQILLFQHIRRQIDALGSTRVARIMLWLALPSTSPLQSCALQTVIFFVSLHHTLPEGERHIARFSPAAAATINTFFLLPYFFWAFFPCSFFLYPLLLPASTSVLSFALATLPCIFGRAPTLLLINKRKHKTDLIATDSDRAEYIYYHAPVYLHDRCSSAC